MELYSSSILKSLVYYRQRSIRTAVAYSNNAKNDDYGCKICRDLFSSNPARMTTLYIQVISNFMN